jgi:hypothetical protein
MMTTITRPSDDFPRDLSARKLIATSGPAQAMSFGADSAREDSSLAVMAGVGARAEESASDEAPSDRGEPKGRRGGHQ